MTKKISSLVFSVLLLLTPISVFALDNPLGETSIAVIIGNIIRSLLGITGALALLMFVYGGMLWLTSQGKPEQIKKGKDTFTWAIIGLVVIFTAYILVNVVIAGLTNATSGQTDPTAFLNSIINIS